jgi:hypothetical protein
LRVKLCATEGNIYPYLGQPLMFSKWGEQIYPSIIR